jgi:hypothetical protein
MRWAELQALWAAREARYRRPGRPSVLTPAAVAAVVLWRRREIADLREADQLPARIALIEWEDAVR